MKKINTIALGCGLVALLASCPKDDNLVPTSTPSEGTVIFWTSNLAAHGGFVNVTLKDKISKITVNWMSQPPNCLSTNGVAHFYLEAGEYDYSTIDYFGFRSTGRIAVIAGDCNKKFIE